MTRRYILTLFSTILLLGFYSVYAQFSKQLLKRPAMIAEQHQRPTPGNTLLAGPGPRASREVALKYLSDISWPMQARVKVHVDGMHLFFNKRQQLNGNKELRISPVAMVWNADEPDSADKPKGFSAKPIVIIAESATFVFDEAVELADIQPRMLQSAYLRGKVKIRGADGLEVTGRTFVFSRANQHIRSENPVYFQMQQSFGNADNIQLNLDMLDGGEHRNQPLIRGITSIQTLGQLTMNLVPKPGEEPVFIQGDKSFRYDMKTQLAVLKGNVFVTQSDEQGYANRIDCQTLQLQFAKTENKTAQPGEVVIQPDANMTIRSMHATGMPVVCRSQKSQLEARGKELDYDFEKKIIVLDGFRKKHPHDPPLVDIDYGNTKLETPRLEIHLGEKNEPLFAHCQGPGQLTHLNENSSPPVVASTDQVSHILADAKWNDSLTFAPERSSSDNLKVITLTGNVMITSPANGSGMYSNTVRLWLETEDPQLSQKVNSSQQASSPNWKLRKALAEGNVAIASPDVEGQYETFTLNFQQRSAEQLAAILDSPVAEQSDGIQQVSGEKKKGADLDLQIHAKHLSLDIQHDNKFKQFHVAHAETQGDVVAAGKLPDEEETFSIVGQNMTIDTRDDQSRLIHLFGTPQRFASIQNGPLRIDGMDLKIDTGKNYAKVLGAGSLQIPVKTDLEGGQLDQVQLLEVTWSEEMRFQGQHVRFIGDVKAVLLDSKITCKELTVVLDQPISMSRTDKQAEPQIAEIVCIDGVRLEMNEFKQGKLVAVRYIQVATFGINHITGDIKARGPGKIDIWQRSKGNSPLKLSIKTSPNKEKQRASQTDSIQAGWDYTQITFAGDMEGNIQEKNKQGLGTLNDRVNVLHGPVSGPLVEFTRDKRPSKSVWMKCDQLEILARSVEDKTNPEPKHSWSIELQAKHNATIEAENKGDQFSVRADLITFDQQRNLFVMRALENRHVSMWYTGHSQATRSRQDVKMIFFSPEHNLLKLDRSIGGSGSQ